MTHPAPLLSKSGPWYLNRRSVILGLVIFGPLALPLLFLSPRFSLPIKILITALFVVSAVFLWKYSVMVYTQLKEQLSQMKEMGIY